METINAFEKLTQLQKKVGYEVGSINSIALLGLFGEAGEVLADTIIVTNGEFNYGTTDDDGGNHPSQVFSRAIKMAHEIDALKKKVRDEKMPLHFILPLAAEHAFDVEVADTLYYLNAIAIGRGKTLADYAEISYQKVSAKVQINISKS